MTTPKNGNGNGHKPSQPDILVPTVDEALVVAEAHEVSRELVGAGDRLAVLVAMMEVLGPKIGVTQAGVERLEDRLEGLSLELRGVASDVRELTGGVGELRAGVEEMRAKVALLPTILETLLELSSRA